MQKRSLLLLLALFSFACAKERMEQLSERADAYNRSLRWGSLTAAGSLITGENRRTLLQRISEEMGKNRIVDYSIVDLSVDDRKENGTVVVEFSFYSLSTQDLNYRQEAQTWQYNSKKEDWFLLDSKPLGGR